MLWNVPAWARRLNQMTFCGPFQTDLFCDSVTCIFLSIQFHKEKKCICLFTSAPLSSILPMPAHQQVIGLCQMLVLRWMLLSNFTGWFDKSRCIKDVSDLERKFWGDLGEQGKHDFFTCKLFFSKRFATYLYYHYQCLVHDWISIFFFKLWPHSTSLNLHGSFRVKACL